MPTKLSEKKLFLGIILLITALALLLKATIFNAPVRVSEKSVLFVLTAIILLIGSVKMLKRAFAKI